MKKILYILFTLLIVVMSSCVSSGGTPKWINDIESEYPENRYIARGGTGKTQEVAELDAFARLSNYFGVTVNSNKELQELYISKNDKLTTEEELHKKTTVESQVKLFAVEYSKPYYDKSTKQTSVVVYIDRSKAWKMYETKIKNDADVFKNQYVVAQANNDKLKKFFLLSATKEPAYNFLLSYEFGMLLSPTECSRQFNSIANMANSLNADLNDLKMECVMAVKVQNDVDRVVQRKITALLSKIGFPVQSKNSTYHVSVDCVSAITYAKDSYGETFSSYPGVSVVIESNGSAVFSYSKSCPKTVAMTKEKNIVMSYQKLSKELDDTFIKEFTTFMSSR